MIKKTLEHELEQVHRMEIACFPHEFWSLEQVYSHHIHQESLIKWIDKIPVGYLVYSQNRFEVEVLRLGVLPDFRKQKIASELIQFIVKTQNPKDIFLEVSETNKSALSLYSKNGFTTIGKRKGYYQDKSSAILMKFSALERL